MEFAEVVRRRRMVRRYRVDDDGAPVPVSRETLTELLDLATRAPSAGFSQGWGFLVLDTADDRERWWQVTAPTGGADSWLRGMQTASVVVVVLSDPAAYAERYARPDKRGPLADAAAVAHEAGLVPDWPVPWWDVDAGMAALVVLLGAVDRGLAGCLAGVPAERWDAAREAFGVPARLRPVGIVTLGVAADGADRGRGRTRRPADKVARFGRWS